MQVLVVAERGGEEEEEEEKFPDEKPGDDDEVKDNADAVDVDVAVDLEESSEKWIGDGRIGWAKGEEGCCREVVDGNRARDCDDAVANDKEEEA